MASLAIDDFVDLPRRLVGVTPGVGSQAGDLQRMLGFIPVIGHICGPARCNGSRTLALLIQSTGSVHSVSRISPVSETRTSRVLPSAAFLPRIS